MLDPLPSQKGFHILLFVLCVQLPRRKSVIKWSGYKYCLIILSVTSVIKCTVHCVVLIEILRDKLGRLLSMGILPNGCHGGCKLAF